MYLSGKYLLTQDIHKKSVTPLFKLITQLETKSAKSSMKFPAPYVQVSVHTKIPDSITSKFVIYYFICKPQKKSNLFWQLEISIKLNWGQDKFLASCCSVRCTQRPMSDKLSWIGESPQKWRITEWKVVLTKWQSPLPQNSTRTLDMSPIYTLLDFNANLD